MNMQNGTIEKPAITTNWSQPYAALTGANPSKRQVNTGNLNTKYGVLGELMLLLANSDYYREFTVSDIATNFAPSISLEQSLLIRTGGRAVGFASWAYFSAEAEQKYLSNEEPLKAADWRSGERLWFVDFITPYGGAMQVVRLLAQKFARDENRYSAHTVRREPDGSVRKIWRIDSSRETGRVSFHSVTRQ